MVLPQVLEVCRVCRAAPPHVAEHAHAGARWVFGHLDGLAIAKPQKLAVVHRLGPFGQDPQELGLGDALTVRLGGVVTDRADAAPREDGVDAVWAGPCLATKLEASAPSSVVTTHAKSSASALISGDARGRGMVSSVTFDIYDALDGLGSHRSSSD